MYISTPVNRPPPTLQNTDLRLVATVRLYEADRGFSSGEPDEYGGFSFLWLYQSYKYPYSVKNYKYRIEHILQLYETGEY